MTYDMGLYILKDRVPVKAADMHEWARWYESFDRVVAQWTFGDTFVSTVFLGIDHNHGWGPPALFETMVFVNDKATDFQRRTSTWDEAEAGHMRACKLVRRLERMRVKT